MQKAKIIGLSLAMIFLFVLVSPASAAPTWDRNPKDFEHGIALDIDGEIYYFAGPGSVMGVIDVPGHTWVQSDLYKVVGRHYNVGPHFVPEETPWWAKNEPYGVLLFKVDGIIAPWTMEIAHMMFERGYVHYHELVDEYGLHHPMYVVWLKHTAVRFFNFNGGPRPDLGHEVTPGIDYEFMPNYMMPYEP